MQKGGESKATLSRFLQQLERLGGETSFKLGDRDIATHIKRTCLLRAGLKLSDVTDKLRNSLGIKTRILPMSDDAHRDEG